MLTIMGVKLSSEQELDEIMMKATGGATDEINLEQFKALHMTLTR